MRPGDTVRLARDSHIGHGSVIHGATLERHVLVGMGAILHDRVRVGEEAIIGSGCVVLEGTEIPPGKVVIGVPGRVVADVTPEQAKLWWAGTRLYQGLPARCKAGLRRVG
jgi:carbonic anhydrase/acetyltransferase-like protein (isoleucine patch superfamily)